MDQQRENITEQLFSIVQENISAYVKAKLSHTLNAETVDEIVGDLIEIQRGQLIENISVTIDDVKRENRQGKKLTQAMIHEHQLQIDEYKGQLCHLCEQNQQLREKLREHEMREQGISKLLGTGSQKTEERIVQMLRQLDQRKEQVVMKSMGVQKLKQEIKLYETNMVSYITQIKKIKEEHRDYKSKYELVLKEREQLKIKNEEMIRECSKRYKEYEQQIRQKEQSIQSHKIIGKDKQSRIQQIIKESDKVKSSYNILKQQNEYLRQIIYRLQATTKELRIQNGQLQDKLQEQQTICSKQIQAYNNKLSSLQCQLNNKEQEIINMLSYKSQYQQMRKQNTEIKEINNIIEHSKQQMKNIHEHQQQQYTQIIHKYQQQIQELQHQHQQYQQDISKLSQQYKHKQAQAQQLTRELTKRQKVHKYHFKNKPKVYYHLYNLKEEIIKLKGELHFMKTKVQKQFAFLFEYVSNNMGNFKLRASSQLAQCQICRHQAKCMRQVKDSNNRQKLNKGKFNKKQIELLKAKYEMVTQKNVLMINQINS